MKNLTDILFTHCDGLGVNWGWAEDPAQPFHRWVLYVDAPAGQVSFHAESKGDGPLYSKPWDRIRGQGPTRISRWAVDLLNGKPDPLAPVAEAIGEEVSNVVRAHFASATETERQRFEAWAGSQLGPAEASTLLARSKGGDYVLATARAGWAAWEARGLIDGKA